VCSFDFVGAVEFSVKKIWDTAPHSAFTDLIRFNDAFYCTFREGTGHVPGKKTGDGDGEIRVIKSKDGETWESVALLTKKSYDLRDSKLSVTPDGRLMLIIGGSVYVNGNMTARHPQVSFSDKNGENFSEPEPIKIEEKIRSEWDWLWRVTWHKGIGYGVVYRIENNKAWGTVRNHSAGLVKTTDGINYNSINEFDFPLTDAPNEATVRFDEKDNMLILLRREGSGYSGVFAESAPPYSQWNWKETGKRLGGPNFIFLPSGKILIGTRIYENGVGTGLCKLNTEGKMETILRLPSGGDTSYPGMVIHNDFLWVSYYSSHEGKTSIYLAKISLAEIENALE
jgi:hypothetical protein